jgi:hypothetical protein
LVIAAIIKLSDSDREDYHDIVRYLAEVVRVKNAAARAGKPAKKRLWLARDKRRT